jgi:uncharacterized membrane protein
METTKENLETVSAVEGGKTMAIVAYLTLIGLVAALVMNNEKKNTFARFHIRQSLGLMLTGLATSIISWIPFLGWIVGLIMFVVLVVMWIIGIMNAVNGKEKALPLLGDKYAEWFKEV